VAASTRRHPEWIDQRETRALEAAAGTGTGDGDGDDGRGLSDEFQQLARGRNS
jgi:hypothetical protein